MANITTFVLFFLVGLVALIVCSQKKIWALGWRSSDALGMLGAVVLGMLCADWLRESLSGLKIVVMVGMTCLMTVPLIAASHWLGQAGGWPLAGKFNGGLDRRIGECLGAVVFCLLVTLILVEVFGWRLRTGWTLPFLIHREDSAMTAVGAAGFLLGYAVLEELVYRGVLLRWICWEARRWKHAIGLAVVLSTLFFTIGHGFYPLRIAQTSFIGGCFAWVSLRHGLWSAAATHGVFNVIVVFWARTG